MSDFPIGRNVTRGVFLDLLMRKYPDISVHSLHKMLIRHVEPIATKGQYHKYGPEQWQQACQWIETRSRAYQQHLARDIVAQMCA